VFVANMTGNVVFLGSRSQGRLGSPSRHRSSRWGRSCAAHSWAAKPFPRSDITVDACSQQRPPSRRSCSGRQSPPSRRAATRSKEPTDRC
jgi:hypothetical protein